MTHLTLFSAFLAGLLGSVHCVGMCGGIMGALTMSLPNNRRQSYWQLLPYLLSYNLGRISSYTLAGLFVGFLGAQFVHWLLPLGPPHFVASFISSVFMVVLGLYIGAWWPILVNLEKLGSYLWRKVEPLGRYFLPVKYPLQAFGLGLVWGWLPCGLVYSLLFFALASTNAWYGGLLMLSFGLGTLPMLLIMGTAVQWLTRFVHQLIIRRIVGAGLIMLGILILLGFYPSHVHLISPHH